jgi:hypothetical protein
MPVLPCIWKTPFTSFPLPLQSLYGTYGGTVSGVSPDGSTIYGLANPILPPGVACRWDTTTLAVTVLASVATGSTIGNKALGCSNDKQTIIGGGVTTGGVEEVQPVATWSGAGATGSLLPFRTGATYTAHEWGHAQMPCRMWSDDGTVVICLDDVARTVATGSIKYVSGTPVALPGSVAPGVIGSTGINSAAQCVSADGTIVCGSDSATIGNPVAACYWVGTTLHRLVIPSEITGVTVNCSVGFCTSDGSLKWGQISHSPQQYACWTSDTTYFLLGTLPNTHPSTDVNFVTWVADDAAAQVAVGYTPVGASTSHACKWVGATATDLGSIGGINAYSEARCCNHNGTSICGISYDAPGGATWAVRWDATNTMHVLPNHGNPDDPSHISEAIGMSRDGSVIFGYAWFPPETDGGVVTATLTDAELVFNRTPGFVDLSNAAERRLFIASAGTPAWIGSNGALPFGGTVPAVYLTTLGPPLNFAQNNGAGGAFAPSGTIGPATSPGCTPYYATEATGPASKPQWRLSVSDDGGRTWNPLVKPRDIGKEGDYLARLRWLKMGHARERMVRLECTDPVRRNIIGIYMDLSQGNM